MRSSARSWSSKRGGRVWVDCDDAGAKNSAADESKTGAIAEEREGMGHTEHLGCLTRTPVSPGVVDAVMVAGGGGVVFPLWEAPFRPTGVTVRNLSNFS